MTSRRQTSVGPGEGVSEARRARGWSQSELAERAGVSRPTVARIEAGQQVRLATLEAVAQVLGLTVKLELGPERRL